eukprot:s564_g13.t1
MISEILVQWEYGCLALLTALLLLPLVASRFVASQKTLDIDGPRGIKVGGCAHGWLIWRHQLGGARYVLAPMVNGSELPFRLLVRRANQGAVQLCYSPMLYCSKVLQDAADGLLWQHFLTDSDEDRPLIVQLASNSPHELAAAARIVAPFCDGVCLNLGCPQWFAERCQLGAFLLEKPALCADLISALAGALGGAKKAVCCKILLLDGETAQERQVRTVSLAQQLAAAGCTLLAIHGRTRAQKNDGPVDYVAIREVQAAVDIPVLVNGGITCGSHADAARISEVLQQTGCAAAMIATAFLADPSLLRTDVTQGSSAVAVACEHARRYLDLCYEVDGPDQPWAQLPLHLGHLLKRFLREKEAADPAKRTGRYEFLKRLSKGDPPDGFTPCRLEEATLLLRNFEIFLGLRQGKERSFKQIWREAAKMRAASKKTVKKRAGQVCVEMDVALEGARLAIRARDVGEMHRSLAALLGPTAPCAARVRAWSAQRRDEVAGFRLIYLTHGGLLGEPGRLSPELAEFLQEHLGQRKDRKRGAGPCLRYAVQLHRARASGNWCRHLGLATEGPQAGKGFGESSRDDCGRLAWTVAAPVRLRSLEILAKAFPQGVAAERAARMLGLQGPEDLESWLKTEWPGEELLRSGQLESKAIASCFEKQRQAAAKREIGRGFEPNVAELQSFTVSHAEVLKKAEAKRAKKAASKAAKKAAKKEKKEKRGVA